MNTISCIHREKNLFLPLIEKFLARKRWAISFSGDSPTSENTQHCLRLVAVVKGRARFRLSNGFKNYENDFGPGGLAVVLPSGYLNHWPTHGEYWTFQCIFWENYIRLLYGNQSVCYWYHTFAPINNSGRLCLQALSQLCPEERLQPQAHHLLRAIYGMAYSELSRDEPRIVTKSMETYYSIEEYLSSHFLSPMTNRDSVAKALAISPQHISRLFNEFGKDGFNVRLKKLRLDHAIELLVQKTFSLDEIAGRSGFASTGYFIREFRKYTGLTPGRYRQGYEKSPINDNPESL